MGMIIISAYSVLSKKRKVIHIMPVLNNKNDINYYKNDDNYLSVGVEVIHSSFQKRKLSSRTYKELQ